MNYNLVSVYIPTHNRKDLVIRAIESVLSQTYSDIEVIVVDDGSTDNTYQHLKSIYEYNEKVVLIRNEISKGACYSRNTAIERANGYFITGLDDDDYFEPDRIDLFVKSWSDNVSALYSDLKLKKSDGIAVYNRPVVVGVDDIFASNCVGNQVFTKKSYLIDVGLFDEKLPAWQDYDLWIRLIKMHGNMVVCRGTTYVMDVSHPHERISKNTDKVKLAYDIFVHKHSRQKIDTLMFLNSYLSYPGVNIEFSHFLSYVKHSRFKLFFLIFLKKILGI